MKKGQAAMEFLMTYGWAILVVLAAIGALAYFGVLSPDRFLPDKCIINPPLSCTEFLVSDSGNIGIGIQNNAGVTLSSVSLTLTTTDCGITTSQPITLTSVENGRKLNNSVGSTLVNWTCPSTELTSGDKFQGSFDITYTKSGESVSHTTSGSITTKVEG